MNLDLDDELEELRSSIARLAADYRSADGACDNSLEFWTKFVESGWPALALPEDRGGAGGSLAACGVVLEEIARNGFMTPFLSSLVVPGDVLARCLPRSAHADLFAAMIACSARIALALGVSEGLPGQSRCSVEDADDGASRFSGRIEHVTGGGRATYFIVAGRDARRDYAVALIPADHPGLHLRRFPTWRGEDAADLELDCTVTDAQVIARGPTAAELVAAALHRGRLASCWEAMGMIQGLLDDTIEHVRTRVQFGGPMTNLQVIRHRIAEMSVHQREAQMVVRGATVLARDARGDRVVLAARSRVAEAARYIGRQAVQLHGAMATTQESSVAATFRKLTAFDQLYGSTATIVGDYADALIGTDDVRLSAILP